MSANEESYSFDAIWHSLRWMAMLFEKCIRCNLSTETYIRGGKKKYGNRTFVLFFFNFFFGEYYAHGK